MTLKYDCVTRIELVHKNSLTLSLAALENPRKRCINTVENYTAKEGNNVVTGKLEYKTRFNKQQSCKSLKIKESRFLQVQSFNLIVNYIISFCFVLFCLLEIINTSLKIRNRQFINVIKFAYDMNKGTVPVFKHGLDLSCRIFYLNNKSVLTPECENMASEGR